MGYMVFVVQDGGWCASSHNAESLYNRHGLATDCINGVGNVGSSDVYKITLKEGKHLKYINISLLYTQFLKAIIIFNLF